MSTVVESVVGDTTFFLPELRDYAVVDGPASSPGEFASKRSNMGYRDTLLPNRNSGASRVAIKEFAG